MREGNRLVFPNKGTYTEALIVSHTSTNCGPKPEEGEIKLNYTGHVNVYGTTAVDVNLPAATLLVQGNEIGVQCEVPDNTNLVRAGHLLNHVLKMIKLPKTRPQFIPEVYAGDSGESDSGDEDVPLDSEIPRVFDYKEIYLVQHVSDDVWKSYTRSIESSFSNGPGKFCMVYLGKMLAMCTRDTLRFETLCSTHAGGSGDAGAKDMQAGCCIVTHISQAARTRGSNPATVAERKRRFSDVSTYDHAKKI
jgi:hypothetical protein